MLVSGLRQLHLLDFVTVLLMLTFGLVLFMMESVSVLFMLGLSKVLPLFVMQPGQFTVFFLDKSVLRKVLLSDVSPLLNP